MAYSKLSIINDCLLLTGQNRVSVVDDGSNEWRVCSAAYDQAVKHLIQEHDWKFGTDFATLSRTGDSLDADFEDAYALPAGCLNLIWVRVNDLTGYQWRVAGNQVLITSGGLVVTAKFIEEPGPELWPPMFVSALECLVQAGIYRGLKREENEASRRESAGQVYLDKARSRTDQQEPKRTLFRGTLRTKRLLRRG